MGIVKKAKEELTSRQKKSSDLTWDGSRGWSVARGTDVEDLPDEFEEHVLEGLRRNPVVAAAVREIQTSMSEAPIHAFRENDDGRDVRVPDHEIEELFNRPNRRDSYVAFIERSVQHFILGGNSFWRKRRNNAGFPTELIPIRPDRVIGAETNNDGFPTRFTIHEEVGQTTQTVKVPFDDIVHIPDADPLNEVFGMPRVLAAVLDIATDNEASNYVNEVLGNYGSPGTVVTVNAERANRKMLERAEALWQQKFGPGRGRGKVAFIPGGEQVQQIGFNLRDLEFEALRQVTRESIAAAIGVDPMVINITTAGRSGTLSGNEYKEARRKLWVQTLIPMIRRWEAAINAFLTPEFGDVFAKFDLAEIVALQEDRASQIDRARKMVQAGATMQEARKEMGLDPDPEEDDMFVLTGRTDVIPVSFFSRQGMRRTDANDATDGEGRGDSGNDDSSDDDSDDDEDEDGEGGKQTPSPLGIMRKDIFNWMRNHPVEEKRALKPGVSVSPEGSLVRHGNEDDKDRAWKLFEGFASSHEAGYRLAAQDVFARQRGEIIRLARRVIRPDGVSSADRPTEQKQVDPNSIGEFEVRLDEAFEEYDREWERRFRPLYEQSSDAVAARLSGAVGVALTTFDDRIQQMIDDRLEELVNADRRTQEAIMIAVNRGVRDGIHHRELIDEIRQVFDEGITYTRSDGTTVHLGDVDYRSELIARTESTEASNGAAYNMMVGQTVIPWIKLWLSMRDVKVRPSHEAEDEDSHAGEIPLEEPFPNTGRQYAGGVHCRCVTLYEQPEEDPLLQNEG